MLPFGIGFSEVLLIGIVLLLVVGPHKLPDIAKSLGKGVRTLRKAGQELRDALEVEDIKRSVFDEPPRPAWRPPPEPVKDVEPDASGTYAEAAAVDATAGDPDGDDVAAGEAAVAAARRPAPAAGAVPRGAAPPDDIDDDDIEDAEVVEVTSSRKAPAPQTTDDDEQPAERTPGSKPDPVA
ncbi:MAG: twin-arginine translocase TatA/TatE family subunit [Myxococcales bacterium]|nr:twin-arginine translocase TatA/TatE family subunit [Myxococcales bacterium]